MNEGPNQNQEPVFTPELRLKLSTQFMESLKKNKVLQQENEKISREIVGASEEDIEAGHGLAVFKRSVHDLIDSKDFRGVKLI